MLAPAAAAAPVLTTNIADVPLADVAGFRNADPPKLPVEYINVLISLSLKL